MMGTRLEKLEKDLSLLTIMQNLILSDCQPNKCEDTRNNTPTTSTKDSSGKFMVRNNRHNEIGNFSSKLKQGRNYLDKDSKNRNCKQNHYHSCMNNKSNLNNCQCKSSGETNDLYHDHDHEHENETYNEGEGVVEKLQKIEDELKFAREKRIEIEEASTIVAIKLQKTEDELQRETSIKKALLIETLELKNHVQDYFESVHQLELEVKIYKEEQYNSSQKIKVLDNEKIKLQKELVELNKELKKKSSENLKPENDDLKEQLKELQLKLNTLHESACKDEAVARRVNKDLQVQVDQLVDKCAQLEKDKEGLIDKVSKISDKSQSTKTKLLSVQDQLHELQIYSNSQKLKYDSLLKKSSINLAHHKAEVTTQINQCFHLLTKTKNSLTQLHLDKSELQNLLEQSRQENNALINQLNISNVKLNSLEKNESLNQQQINSIISQNMNRIASLQNENSSLKCQLKQVVDEKQAVISLTKLAKHKFLQEQTKFNQIKQNDAIEKEKLESKLTNIQDNFNVLRKINQDHINTMQKLKIELDETKKHSSKLEQNLIEKTKAEQKLMTALQKEESNCFDLQDQIEFLHGQLKGLESNIEQHNCEDHVDSIYKAKLLKLEGLVKTHKDEWRQTIELLRSERDQAIAAGRKNSENLQQIKFEYETKFSKILSSTKKEMNELEEVREQETSQAAKKISELEMELIHVRSESNNVQRTLSNKIQQLQYLLTTTTMCLGDGTAASAAGLNPNSGNNNSMTMFDTYNDNNNTIFVDNNLNEYNYNKRKQNTNPFL